MLWICAWGAVGAFAVEFKGRAASCYFAPALTVQTVIDSTGAGDVFIGGSLAALVAGMQPLEVLQRGCAIAARKVAQEGLEGLAGD